ncbi:MAG: LPD7 domain-containing protein [Pseudomonadota bacterium]
MPAEDARRPAVLKVEGSGRSVKRGDVPEEILAAYLTDAARGRSLGFYVDARATRPAFRDRGDRLLADRNDPGPIRAMVAVAAHRGWTTISVRGDKDFSREVWREARRRGIEVRGYAPTRRDLEAEAKRDQTRSKPRHPAPALAKPMTPERRAAIVEAVVAARMLDPERARRLLDAARARMTPIVALARGGRDRTRSADNAARDR